MRFIKALEFGFHEGHIGLLGDHAVLVGVHEEEELLDVFFAEGEAVLGLGDGGFLRGGGAQEGDSGEQGGEDYDEPEPVRWIEHG